MFLAGGIGIVSILIYFCLKKWNIWQNDSYISEPVEKLNWFRDLSSIDDRIGLFIKQYKSITGVDLRSFYYH